MKSLHSFAPAHALLVCAGVFVFCAVIAACDDLPKLAGGRRTVELDSGSVQLDSGVKLHDVQIKSDQEGDFNPEQIKAKRGDVVRFTSADTRTHAFVIRPPSEQGRAVLDTSGQLRSPPLVAQGQAWVVSLKGLPAGTYTVSCISHAGTATIQVQ
ncbi:MAG: cupredoxin domain-containing protein [Gemmatimonadota bacterium]